MARDELDPAELDGRGWYAPRHFTTTLIGVDVEEAVEHRYHQTLTRSLLELMEAECGVALQQHQSSSCVQKQAI